MTIQIPPSIVPAKDYNGTDRVQPSHTGWYDPKDPAYCADYWTLERDQQLSQLMLESDLGRTNQYNLIAQRYFPERNERDVRMRWNTWLRPRHLLVDKTQQDALKMKAKAQGHLELMDGRYVRVPRAIISPAHRQLRRVERHASNLKTGLSSLTIMTQHLIDCEMDKKQHVEKKQLADHWMKREQVIRMDQVRWSENEDMLLMEAFELYGPQWERVAKSLEMTRRSAQECRERCEQLFSPNTEN